MKIALTTDHAGLDKLKNLETFLIAKGYECLSFGPSIFDPADDYPDYIFPAAKAVSAGHADVAIIMGGSGQGEAIAANRIAGVRCAVYYGPAVAVESIDANGSVAADNFEIIRLSRQHNNANVLSLGARFLRQEDIEHAVMLWLDTPFTDAERHIRRITKLDHSESQTT